MGRKWDSKCFVQVHAAFPTFHGFTSCYCGFQFGCGCLRVILRFSVEAKVHEEGGKFTLPGFGAAIPPCGWSVTRSGVAMVTTGVPLRGWPKSSVSDMPDNAQCKRQYKYMEHIDQYAVGVEFILLLARSRNDAGMN